MRYQKYASSTPDTTTIPQSSSVDAFGGKLPAEKSASNLYKGSITAGITTATALSASGNIPSPINPSTEKVGSSTSQTAVDQAATPSSKAPSSTTPSILPTATSMLPSLHDITVVEPSSYETLPLRANSPMRDAAKQGSLYGLLAKFPCTNLLTCSTDGLLQLWKYVEDPNQVLPFSKTIIPDFPLDQTLVAIAACPHDLACFAVILSRAIVICQLVEDELVVKDRPYILPGRFV